MDTATLIGLAAGFLTTIAFIPQAMKIWRTRSAEDVSLPTFAAFSVGLVLWTLFGVMKGEPPIIIWNVVTLVLAVAIIVMKLRFKAA